MANVQPPDKAMMEYQIEADWHLLNTCNFRCGYCFLSHTALGEKLQAFGGPEDWTQAFDATGLRWLLHLTGGEPSLYPNFAKLCEGLTRQNFISINSNMTNRAWERFAERIDPARVSFINAGIHLEERKHRAGTAVFLRAVELLRERGFQVFVSMVGSPTALARFEEAVDMLSPIGMFPVPKIMRGTVDAKLYPEAYTATEKQLFRKAAERALVFYAPMLAERSERPTLDLFRDEALLDGEPSYKGLSCEAGRLFVKIDPKGEVYRCGTTKSLGNIRAMTFARTSGPAPCDTRYCVYFCQKYSKGTATRLER